MDIQITKDFKSVFILGLLMSFVVMTSCTDLTENVNNEVTADNFFQTDEEFISALGDAYSPLTSYGGNFAVTAVNEVTSDEIVVAQKGADWEDGGIWIRLHRHTFRPSDDIINNTWNEFFSGVANANRLIFQFQRVIESGNVSEEDANAFIAELRALRAFYYYQLLDNFGNVPIVTSFEQDPAETAQPSDNFQEGRQAVFEFVESELLDVLELVDTDVSGTIGRVNKWVVHMTLAKLYLNAEVYTGESHWDEVVTHTNAIIDSGNYNLMANYADNFTVDNTGSPEHIFTIPFDEVFLQGFNLHVMTNHILSQPAFDFGTQPWNGFQTVTDFYGSYIDSEQNPGPQGDVVGLDPEGSTVTGTLDERLDNFLVGPLLDQEGNQIEDDGVLPSDPNGPPITHTPYINELAPDSWRQAGARIAKYEMEVGLSGSNMNNDMVIYRYSDVLLMKAEALWRMNPNDPTALMLVNQVRERANVDPFSSLDADKLLAERGREMFYEVVRRQDLVRFEGDTEETQFNDPWWEKDSSDPYRNVFPIPQNQLEANPNLVQNPGY
ncbi:RagB/SusD family nutrient uptake outer membrane protein [Aliifodinibius salicampi]|uniref:RagB/SusD family nutrient uptake outer membrane protein n=1 Tax=Fodinibius salicampi TaxID=1920655 RepID=A0ABT3PWF8_9BACT|nr:RagB/SusD family nutrient uptake outer membrane protein [Fodinibius salicampi]MCW9712197.1 RagB/SusD family nutrient uptake outer membrane protein [Fodinibius salicampi]